MSLPKNQMMLPRTLLTGALLLSALITIGCGEGPAASAPNAPSTITLQGRMHGGQQPVSGSHVYLYAAGSTGYASSATSLLSGPGYVTTDAHGGFSLASLYNCKDGDMLYVLAVGGNPGLAAGTNNGALEMMAALGPCSTVTASTYISVNEATTVAAAFALAPFMADGTHIGTSSTNGAGLITAFTNAHNLVDTTTGAPLATTPAGNGTVPQTEINSLANVMAACVNSDGTVSQCSDLFTATTSSSGTPSNTLTAALNIAKAPMHNAGAIYLLASPTGPFQPGLPTAPADWSLAIAHSAVLSDPNGIAIDAQGNVWIADYGFNSLAELSGSGVLISSSYTGGGLGGPYGVAIDPSGDAWAPNPNLSSLSEFSPTGMPLSGNGYKGGGLINNQALAIDGSGYVWSVNHNGNSVSKFNGSGVSQTGSPFTSAAEPTSIAIDGAGNVWTGGFDDHLIALKSDGTVLHSYTGFADIQAIAVDSSNNVWVVDYYTSTVRKISSAGTVLATSSGGSLSRPYYIAIDGDGVAWVANSYTTVMTRISADGTTQSAYTVPGGTDSNPAGLATDPAGSVWVGDRDTQRIVQFVGAGAPTVTPFSTAIANGTLATRP